MKNLIDNHLHFWHIYLPADVALTLSLHSWHKARPKKQQKKHCRIFSMFLLQLLVLPWFFIKPKSASSLWHISQVKHFGCHEPFIALITLPTMNSPKIQNFY